MDEKQKTIKFSELCHFLPRQIEANQAAFSHRYTLYGGSAGPGKSYWLRWFPIIQMIKWGIQYNLTGIHSGLFSTDYGTLKDRQVSKMSVEFPKWLGEIKNTQEDGLALRLHDKYGGHVLALRNLDDPSKYLSSEFAIIAVEELTENDEDVFNTLRSRMRWTGIEDTKFIGATNPGGKGHNWVKKRWIERDFPKEEKEPQEFIYVKALPADNPYLATSYLNTLDSLPENLRKAYRDGNWDVFEGQYFTEWDSTQHVEKPFVIPQTWFKYRSIDISGRTGITSCHWYAVDPDGTLHVYKEYYWDPKKNDGVGRDYDQHAREIAEMSVMRVDENNPNEPGVPEEYRWTVIDSAAFAKQGYSETAAEVYERNGVGGFIKSSKERLVGWDSVHRYMRWDSNTPPKLKIFSTCVNMIRTLPLLQHDKNHPEDIDTTGEDHAGDELRYMTQSLRDTKSEKPLNLVERRIRQMQEKETAFDYQYRTK